MADNISHSGEIAPTEYFKYFSVTNIHFLQAPIDDKNFFPYTHCTFGLILIK